MFVQTSSAPNMAASVPPWRADQIELVDGRTCMFFCWTAVNPEISGVCRLHQRDLAGKPEP